MDVVSGVVMRETEERKDAPRFTLRDTRDDGLDDDDSGRSSETPPKLARSRNDIMDFDVTGPSANCVFGNS